jgi:hypothetical protein
MVTERAGQRWPVLLRTVQGIAIAVVAMVVLMQSGRPAQVAAPVSVENLLAGGRHEFLPSSPADRPVPPDQTDTRVSDCADGRWSVGNIGNRALPALTGCAS